MKKLLIPIVIVIIAVVASVFSVSVFAATPISTVGFYVTPPVIDTTPATDATVYYGTYSLTATNGVRWYDHTESKFLTSGDKFKDGHYYSVNLYIVPDSGYEFATTSGGDSTVTATVNGKVASIYQVSGKSFSEALQITYKFGTPDQKILKTVTLTGLILPEVGNTPSYYVKLSGDNAEKWTFETLHDNAYCVNSIEWFDVTEYVKLAPNHKFKEGNTYTCTVYLTTKAPYEYGYLKSGLVDVDATINGLEADTFFYDSTNRNLGVYIQFGPLYSEETPLTDITLDRTVTTGTSLTSDFFAVPSCVSNVTVEWTDKSGNPVQPGSSAIPGEFYTADITLTAQSGYIFDFNTLFRVFGGEQMAYQILDNGKTAKVMSSIGVECPHDNVAPNWLDDALVHWKICNTCGENVFVEEHKYGKGVVNGATTVYTCTVCGHEHIEDNESSSVVIGLPKIEFTSTFGDICKKTVVTMTNGDPSVISYSFATSEETIVIVKSNGNWLLPGGGDVKEVMNMKPTGSTQYTFTVDVLTNKYITNESITVVDTSKTASNIEVSTRDNTYAVVSAQYYTESSYVSLIDISGIAAPKVGAKQSDKFKIDNEHGLEDVSMTWSPADKTFVCGKEYKATIVIKAAKDYTIAAEQFVEVAGCSNVKATLKNGLLTIECTYPALAHSYGGWKTVKEATETEKGLQERVCSVCGDKQTKETDVLVPSHVHEFTMKSDEVGHWTECTCGEVTTKEAHVYGADNKCTVCGFTNPEAVTEAPSEKPSEGASESPSDKPTDAPAEKPTEAQKPGEQTPTTIPMWVIIALVAVASAALATVVVMLILRKKK